MLRDLTQWPASAAVLKGVTVMDPFADGFDVD
jgi:hypothetical protein